MKFRVFIVHCLFAYLSSFAAEKIQVVPKPSWIMPVSVSYNDRHETGDVSDGYFYLLYDLQVNTILQEKYIHEIRKIISDEGVQNGSELSIDYDPAYEKLNFCSLKITRNGQCTDRTHEIRFKIIQPETHLNEHIYEGKLTALAFLPDIRKGDIIEYAYSLVGFNPVFENKFFNFISYQTASPLPKFYYRLLMPLDKEIQIKTERFQSQAKIKTIGNEKEYIWQIENIAALKNPEQIPDWYDASGYLQVSEFKSWEQMKDWANRLFSDEVPLSLEVKKCVFEIKNKYPTKALQLVSALRFVQDEVRYTGIETGEYAHKPESPNLVYSQRYGDCKGKSVLLCTLLKQLGIEAYPALVNSYYTDIVAHFLPAPDDFNHCIVKVNLDQHEYWFDPTISYQHGMPGNIYCPPYGKALVLHDDSKELSEIHVSSPGNTQVEETFIISDSVSPARLNVFTNYFGSDADEFRANLESTGLSKMEDNFIKFYEKRYPEISSLKSVVITDDSLQNRISSFEQYELKNLWKVVDSTTHKVKASFYADILQGQVNEPSSINRTMPYALNYPKNYKQVIKIILWDKWDIKEEEIPVKNKWVDFFYKTSLSDDTIVINFSFKTLRDHVMPSEIAAYENGVKSIFENTGYILTRNPDALEPKKNINFLMVIVALLFMGLFTGIAIKIYQKSIFTDYPGEPLEIGGWLFLIIIGLIVTPIRICYHIFSTSYFDQTTWTLLTSVSSESYNPLWSAVLTYELIGNLFTIVISIFCLLLLFKKRDIFPRVMIVYLAANFLFIITDYFFAIQIPTVKEAADTDSVKEIIRSFIAAAIWIPYMLKSERVNETFTRPYRFNKHKLFSVNDVLDIQSTGSIVEDENKHAKEND